MEKEDLERSLERAKEKLTRGLTMSSGGSAAESEYSKIYQLLVRYKFREQIKKKYRGT